MVMIWEWNCAGALMVCPTSDRALHYLMLCRLLCPVHCEPQEHIRGTATDVRTETQAAG